MLPIIDSSFNLYELTTKRITLIVAPGSEVEKPTVVR